MISVAVLILVQVYVSFTEKSAVWNISEISIVLDLHALIPVSVDEKHALN